MNMHWCIGKINLSGQGFMVLHIDPLEPISWPEAQVIMTLHGEENVYDLKPVSISETSPVDEKNRLLGKYGKVVERVFPGRSPRMEMLMPGEGQDQKQADSEGKLATSNGHPTPPQPGDDDEEDDDAAVKPPEPAVFKPGKHTPPHKGA